MKPVPAHSRARWRIHFAALLACSLLLALGSWQLARRSWKLALMARVESRVHARAELPPPPSCWSQVSVGEDEYRHVRLHGVWLAGRETLVAGVSVLGSGYWQLVPLRLDDGSVVLVNRGFLSAPVSGTPDLAADGAPVSVTGLLRLSEPGGRLLRPNDPAAGRWYSRDLAAIARARGLPAVAPYFVDADAASPAVPGRSALPSFPADDGERLDRTPTGAIPVAGLTVVAFPNNHLAYALTWFTLAAMVALAWRRVLREPQGLPHIAPQQGQHGQPGGPVDREHDRD